VSIVSKQSKPTDNISLKQRDLWAVPEEEAGYNSRNLK
jgi:hypothetical protein